MTSMMCVQDVRAPEAVGQFVESVRMLTPRGQEVMAWLLEYFIPDTFGAFVRGAARALGSMQR